MAKFLTGKDLEDTICNIIWGAKEKLLIVSPFIKLDDFFATHFKKQLGNPHLHLLVVFGKNEYDKSKSLNQYDFEFFKSFPKVSIIYVSNLHAKYYGNETKGVITSVNMYDSSFRHNIEFGVYSENSILDNFTQSSDKEAWNKCIDIAQGGEPIFIKRPVFKKKLLSILGKDYMSSTVLLDNTEQFYSYGSKQRTAKKLTDFEEEIDYIDQAEERPTRETFKSNTQVRNDIRQFSAPVRNATNQPYEQNTGYCIRTGVQIPFNPNKPLCNEAFKSWAEWKNYDYKEKYCHKTGRPSYGKTSMRNPIIS